MGLQSLKDIASFGSRDALVVDGERISYEELHRRIEECRAALHAWGVGPDSRVGVLLPNSAAMIVTILAAWENGALVLPVNTRYRAPELRYVVTDSQIELLITAPPRDGAPDLRERITEAFTDAEFDTDVALADAPTLRRIATWPFAPATAPAPPSPATPPAEQLLIYTSGTTSNPKGCVHDLAAFEVTAHHTASAMELGAADVVWDPLPLFHTGGLLPLLGSLQRGATFCTTAHFEAESALRMIEREQVTVAYPAFSTLITALLDAPGFATTDTSSLRWILAIGPQGLLERVQQHLPTATQVSCYGCTEIGGVIVYNRVGDSPSDRALTAGVPFDGVEIAIVDPATGDDLPVGSTGEIVVRANSVLRGYHRESSSPVDGQGRFHTGDLGRMDANGNLLFDGRLKDMLKVGGENVAASEIEFVLVEHPAVTLAAVVPVPDDRLIEVPAAFVELKPGHHASEDELIAFCAQRLAGFKVPREVHFVTTWPMSATKVQKFRLRDQLVRERETTGAHS